MIADSAPPGVGRTGAGEATASRRRVLIVEDDAIVAKDLEYTLDALGYRVPTTFSSGEAALDWLDSYEVDLVLMDIRLAGDMDGTEAAARVRDQHDAPVVYLTAYADDETVERAKATTPYGYVVKPFVDKELRSAVEVALYKHDMERRLLESQRWLAATLRCIGDGVVATDRNGEVAFMNSEAERLIRRSQEDVRGEHVSGVLRFVRGEEGTELPNPVVQALERREPVRLDEGAEIVGSDGDRVPVSDQATPIRDESGELLGAVAVVRDVTSRRVADEALRASEERYRRLFEQDAVANTITRPDGRVVACNRSFVELFGFESVEDAIGSRMEELYADPAEHGELVDRVRADEELVNHEATLRRLDGSPVPVLMTFGPRFDADGELVEIHSHLVDISEQRQLERQLRQIQKMQGLGQLAGGLAHEFNNLLTGILGHAKLASDAISDLEGPSGDPARHALETIDELGNRGARLVRHLLAFSRDEPARRRKVDLNRVVRDHTEMLEHVLDEEIRLEIDPGAESAVVDIDVDQIEQVLMNLVLNACDAMPDGGRIEVSTREVTLDEADASGLPGLDPGDHVVLAIEDTGRGMDEVTQSRVFEPFFTTKEVGTGTGLGLSIVYGIVQRNGGAIVVDGEPDRGTTFRIFLPRVRGGATELQEEPSPMEPAASGSETVVIVDDDESVRDLVCRILERKGYEVESCAGGREALDLLGERRDEVDLLITDVAMPGMTGPELVDRALAERADLDVLFITGYADAAGRIGASFDLVERFPLVDKPFDPEELARTVRRILDGEWAPGGEREG